MRSKRQQDDKRDVVGRGHNGELVQTPYSSKRSGRKARVGETVELANAGTRYLDCGTVEGHDRDHAN